jgi:hypothetical protein
MQRGSCYPEKIKVGKVKVRTLEQLEHSFKIKDLLGTLQEQCRTM